VSLPALKHFAPIFTVHLQLARLKIKMGDQHPIHISIYIKNDSPKDEHEKYKTGYEVEDNDPCFNIHTCYVLRST
jgi:hypothetical protein